MSDQVTTRPFPRGPLLGAGVMVLIALLLTGVSRYTGVGVVAVEPATSIEVRSLRFEDRPDGSVAVVDANTMNVVDTLAPGTNGFVRGVLRGLARERRMSGLSDQAPFELVRWDDRRLSLRDTATGREIELVSFGITQLETFAKMLHDGGDSKAVAHASYAKEE